MSSVGLPGSMVPGRASTILGNIYVGMAVFVNLYPEGLTLAQVSTAFGIPDCRNARATIRQQNAAPDPISHF